ncbi:hypothetical protein ASE00_07700 [Sphingomonas sp. Root710]|uniref:c-type cytochrome n=1 Tax=Sphingomonas sp. Root710 TaxID=1736594 RepID=UPI0006F37C59|nr:c-type cytochrome [Sphingomonas sp. Root710]KRB86564.1 hypothetical protein ASE00_07700 [Sphingomonas sp. Root710]
MRRLIAAIALAPLAACHDPHAAAKALIAERCAACHVVPGIATATGTVGPPLSGIARQQILAGRYPNRPDVMTRWLIDPQAMQPGGAMPSTGLSPSQAKIIADYLYTLDRS